MFLLRFRYDLVTLEFMIVWWDCFLDMIWLWFFLMPLEVSNVTYAVPFAQNMGVELDLCSVMFLS